MNLEFRFYLAGYKGVCLPRWLRRIMAGNRMHRAWLEGYMGSFEEDGRTHGVLDREWYQLRASGADAGILTVVRAILRGHAF
ncbi:hypothetical protein LFL97_23960 [Burkholderia sp. JSH-S8]|nr:hypothetical protein LFL97_23960 [Burkholderia sp. JSH-S8]